MLHTNFQSHRPFGSGEEDFLRLLIYRPQLWTSPGLGEKITIDNPVSELTCLPIYPKEFSFLLITST